MSKPLMLFFLLLLSGSLFAQELMWYRGNTHTHTNKSDGSASPEAVAAWYRDRNYHFLCLTDYKPPGLFEAVKLPDGARKDFLLIPSEEITGTIHATALNIRDAVPSSNEKDLSVAIRQGLAATEKAGGLFVLSHPNYQWSVPEKAIEAVGELGFFEVFNCYPWGVNNAGDDKHPSTEELWDNLLTRGLKLYGIACDDAHSYPGISSPIMATPGKGWIMVRASELTPKALVAALRRGDFYSTIGVVLATVESGPTRIRVEIDPAATEAELARGAAFGRPAAPGAKLGQRIDFIGTGGKLLKSTPGWKADWRPSGTGYVRALAVVTKDVDGQRVEFCAWTQPVFLP